MIKTVETFSCTNILYLDVQRCSVCTLCSIFVFDKRYTELKVLNFRCCLRGRTITVIQCMGSGERNVGIKI